MYAMEERKHKAQERSVKGSAALEKVQRQQRILERQSVKSYKAGMGEMEERRAKKIEDESLRARQGKKEVLQREKAIKARHDREEEDTD